MDGQKKAEGNGGLVNSSIQAQKLNGVLKHNVEKTQKGKKRVDKGWKM